jgi:hypothetical protein
MGVLDGDAAMSLPWIDAWKAWALRVAERLAKPPDVPPPPTEVQRVKPAAKGPRRPPEKAKAALPEKHRSGKRHG